MYRNRHTVQTGAHNTPAQTSAQQLLRPSNWPRYSSSSFSLVMLMKGEGIMSATFF